MAEGYVQVPPNSTGQSFRIETGDGNNDIPEGIAQEVVTIADSTGFLQGDVRFSDLQVDDDQVQEILTVLRQILLTLALGFNIDPASPDDADSL